MLATDVWPFIECYGCHFTGDTLMCCFQPREWATGSSKV